MVLVPFKENMDSFNLEKKSSKFTINKARAGRLDKKTCMGMPAVISDFNATGYLRDWSDSQHWLHSRLVRSTPDQAVWVRALAGDIVSVFLGKTLISTKLKM